MNLAIIVVMLALISPNAYCTERNTATKACKEAQSLDSYVAQADIIVSGVVRKLERHANPNRSTSYGAYIQINGVVKGHVLLFELLRGKQSTLNSYSNIQQMFNENNQNSNSLNNLFNRDDTDEGTVIFRNKSLLKRTKKFSAVGNTIYVRGFGSQAICNSRVHLNDYRILMLRLNQDGRYLYLDSSLMEIYLPLSKYNGKQRITSEENLTSNVTVEENKCKFVFFTLFS